MAVTAQAVGNQGSMSQVRAATVAWLLTAVFYFFQYSLRSAPGVMMPQLSDAFGISALGVASIVGLFYYGYSPFSLVAGSAMDRFGSRRVDSRRRNSGGLRSIVVRIRQ